MQLLPDTAKGIASARADRSSRVSDLEDPEINVRYGAWYLRHLLTSTAPSGSRSPPTTRGRRTSTAGARGVAIQFAETREFVGRVESLKKTYRHAYASLRQQNDT